MAEAKRYPVETQPSAIASIENSLPMEGSAILTDDPSKGVREGCQRGNKQGNSFHRSILDILASMQFSIIH
jgi:hypothetical protein